MFGKWKKVLTAAMVGIATVALFAGCGSSGDQSSNSDAQQAKKYVIACDAKYPPFSIDVNGKYKGIDV